MKTMSINKDRDDNTAEDLIPNPSKQHEDEYLTTLNLVFNKDEICNDRIHRQWLQKRGIIQSAISNFSASYNVLVVGFASQFMQIDYGDENDVETSSVSSVIFVGMLTGQLTCGYLADLLGARTAMMIITFLQIIGATMCAIPIGDFSSLIANPENNGMSSVYLQLCIWRFILGLGAGGVYPVSAALASQSSTTKGSKTAVAWLFAFQGLGFWWYCMFTWATASITTHFYPDTQSQIYNLVVYKILFAFGAVPGLFLLLIIGRELHLHNLRVRHHKRNGECYHRFGRSDSQGSVRSLPNDEAPLERVNSTSSVTTQALSKAVRNPWILARLAGTCLSWFLFDVVYYGMTMFQPEIVENVFHVSSTDIIENARVSLIIISIVMPAYVIAASSIEYIGPWLMQFSGFIISGIFYCLLGVTYTPLNNHNLQWVLVIIYSCTYIFLIIGPATTTFLYPSELFPSDVKGTFNGIAAATGKVGAFAGTAALKQTLSKFGLETVLISCGVISFVGAIVTLIFIDHKETPDHTDNLHTLPRKYQSPMLSRFKAQIQRKQEFDQLHANLLSDNEQMLSRANSPNILVENNSLR